MLTRDDVYAVLATVPDPEVPAISVVDLGIIRDVVVNDDAVRVTVTPTYSGCPAMREIEDDIRSALKTAGANTVEIETVYAPAWTTDWMNAEAREKLRAYGIAPPGPAEQGGLIMLTRRAAPVECPF